MSQEIWKVIKENKKYEVSNFGKIRNKEKKTILKTLFRKGRKHGHVNLNKKMYIVAKVVAQYFLDQNNDQCADIFYKDGDKTNIKYDNLEWKRKKIKTNKVRKQRKGKIIQYDMEMNLIKEWSGLDEILENFNYSYGHLIKCLNGRNSSAYKYIWKYKDYVKKVNLKKDEKFIDLGVVDEVDYSIYEISNYGTIRTKKYKSYIQTKEDDGYLTVKIYGAKNNTKILFVHNLVAIKFLKDRKDFVVHKDNNKMNNHYKNLKWMPRNEGEIWKKINNHSKYSISNLGNIKNKKNKLLTPSVSNGYLIVNMTSDNNKRKKKRAHRLVAEHFIANSDPSENKIVDHIDNKKNNNKSNNLRWVTSQKNSLNYHREQKKTIYLDPILQYDLDGHFIKEWNSIPHIVKSTNYCRGSIASCINGKYKQAYGFVWKRKNKKKVKEIKLEKDEIFKNIGMFCDKDFSKYEISNYGKVKSLSRGIIMSTKEYDGYLKLSLINSKIKKSSKQYVHRLVAHKFIKGRTKEKIQVNHINKKRSHNYYKNLEWVTPQKNTEHAKGIKIIQINPKTKEKIRKYNSITEARKTLKLGSEYGIRKCLKGKISQAAGFIWKYA